MNVRSLRSAAFVMTMAGASLVLPTTPQAAIPGLDGVSPICLNALRKATRTQPSQCIVDDDCVNGWRCQNLACVDPETAEWARRQARAAEAQAKAETRSAADLTAAPTPTAEELCGADRRCRIERLKSNNRARRQQNVFEEERAVQSIVNEFHRQKEEASVRLNNPWTVDFTASFLGWGFSGGYGFTPFLRAEAGFTRNAGYIYHWDGTTSISGYHTAWILNVQAVVMPMETWITPYVAAGFMGGSGSFGSDSWGGWGSTDTDVKYHILQASGGLDAQFDFGLHIRLGFRYGYVLYNQASIGPGIYDPVTRTGLKDWMEEELLSIDFNLGWAF